MPRDSRWPQYTRRSRPEAMYCSRACGGMTVQRYSSTAVASHPVGLTQCPDGWGCGCGVTLHVAVSGCIPSTHRHYMLHDLHASMPCRCHGARTPSHHHKQQRIKISHRSHTCYLFTRPYKHDSIIDLSQMSRNLNHISHRSEITDVTDLTDHDVIR